ncbi:Uncharacterized protein FWK35_00019190 [Aphis craccivora]|uniref:Uncharacterized protein n=1 Tax=Aphis craccivora TaxID=307492 RepID=A0A6G0W3W1_APHCR|nr:Uncharacterized protein FWK35_00019190 [Aphis craccivora]
MFKKIIKFKLLKNTFVFHHLLTYTMQNYTFCRFSNFLSQITPFPKKKKTKKCILSEVINVLILQCCVFFFLSVYTRTCRNNASIFNFGGGFRYQNESSWCNGERREKPKKKKIKEKREFLRKTSFRPNPYF